MRIVSSVHKQCNIATRALGDHAFYGCTGLASVTIPNGLTTIDEGTFSGCTSLTSVTIPNGVTEIKIDAFSRCSNLATVSIGNAIRMIWYDAFAYCPALTDVYCHAVNLPTTGQAFKGSYVEYATLHVPDCAIEDYRATNPWNTFGSIVALDEDAPKCATPTISYRNGELTFSSETEGAEFVSEITDTDIRKNYDAKVSLAVTYNISVYAMKAGHEDSDVAYATLCWIEADPQMENIEEGIAQIPVHPVMIQMQGGDISIIGADDGAEVLIYSLRGQKIGQAISKNGSAVISANLQSGENVIVRIGESTLKVILR